MPIIHVINVESGNLRSLENALNVLGYTVEWVSSPDQITDSIEKLIFPGVGNFGHFVKEIDSRGFIEPLKKYIESKRPLFGICVGLQAFFEGSEESKTVTGLGLVPGVLSKFDDKDKSVPQIGWNSVDSRDFAEHKSLYGMVPSSKYYFVHSYACILDDTVKSKIEAAGWDIATSQYGDQTFVAAISKDNVVATQFHPEKSGAAGLRVIDAFLKGKKYVEDAVIDPQTSFGLTKRVIACLDVRTNDQGDLVVTKGDQYDVREKTGEGHVRNLGKPVSMAEKYYKDGADEVTFLNITSFRDCPVQDLPMLEVLRQTSKTVFVPLTVGGGIRDVTDPSGNVTTALQVATQYFMSGADKVSIGSDAVFAAEEYYKSGKKLSGKTPMETISAAYGVQAVVVSVDPKRVYVDAPLTDRVCIETKYPSADGKKYCWYQCTVKGGREARDLGVFELVQACEALGAGEILLNCIDKDGTNSGFDLELIDHVKSAVKIPVIASSGAGNPGHFEEVFRETTADAALGAGMFHRGEYSVKDVKDFLENKGEVVRAFEPIELVHVE